MGFGEVLANTSQPGYPNGFAPDYLFEFGHPHGIMLDSINDGAAKMLRRINRRRWVTSRLRQRICFDRLVPEAMPIPPQLANACLCCRLALQELNKDIEQVNAEHTVGL